MNQNQRDKWDKSLLDNLKRNAVFKLPQIKPNPEMERLYELQKKGERELMLWLEQRKFADMDFSRAFDAWDWDICYAYRHKDELLSGRLKAHFETNIITYIDYQRCWEEYFNIPNEGEYGFIPKTRIYP